MKGVQRERSRDELSIRLGALPLGVSLMRPLVAVVDDPAGPQPDRSGG